MDASLRREEQNFLVRRGRPANQHGECRVLTATTIPQQASAVAERDFGDLARVRRVP